MGTSLYGTPMQMNNVPKLKRIWGTNKWFQLEDFSLKCFDAFSQHWVQMINLTPSTREPPIFYQLPASELHDQDGKISGEGV